MSETLSHLNDMSPSAQNIPLPGVVTPVDKQLANVEQKLDRLDNVVNEALSQTEPSVSILIPAFNEAETIREIVEQVRIEGIHDEIVIVDDYSTDGTKDLLVDMSFDEDVRVIFHEQNQGKGAALRTALQVATGDIVIVQDADLEYSPSDYPSLLGPLLNGDADVVYGSRYLGADAADDTWLHRFGNQLLTIASNCFTGQKLTDMETCYKAFRRDLVKDMNLRQNRFGFEPELTAKLSRGGSQIVEVPIQYNSRGYDEGKKIGIRDGFNAIFCILRYAWCD